jgi:ribosomal protein L23
MPSKRPERIPVKPHVTEKAGRMQAQNKFVFLIDKGMNKSELKKLVKKEQKVDVAGINIIRIGGVKKAIITLKPGQNINEKV